MTNTEFRAIRTRLGLTQRQLAKVLGLHHMTVWQYEHGRRGISDAVAIRLLTQAQQDTTPTRCPMCQQPLPQEKTLWFDDGLRLVEGRSGARTQQQEE